MDFAGELDLVSGWLDGKVEWEDLPPEVQQAVDEVMVELAPEVQAEEQTLEVITDESDAIPESEEVELLHKANSEHRFTLGPWYIPDRYDAHGEWTDADELQKALWEYVRSGDRGIRLQHNRDVVAGEWVEAMSFPVPVTIDMKKDAGGKQVTYPAGTVFLGVQWKPWAWDMVKEGKIRGFSIGGAAARVEMTMPTDAMGKAKSFGGDRSAAARYAAEQRWKGHTRVTAPNFGASREQWSDPAFRAVARYRAIGRLSMLNIGARASAARAAREAREKAGEATLVDRIRRLLAGGDRGSSTTRWGGTEDVTEPLYPSQTFRPRYESRTGRARERSAEVVRLPSGRTAILSTESRGGAKGRLVTVGKSADAIRAEMRFLAKVRSFGGNRSDAGRYAANCRWMRFHSGQKPGPFPSGARTVLGKKLKAEIEQRNASSLTTHIDYDGLAAEMNRRDMVLADPEAPELVFQYLSPERQELWIRSIMGVLGPIAKSPDGVDIFIKGGGGASGKSTSGKIDGLGYEFPKTYEEQRKGEGRAQAAMVNVDDWKTATTEYKNLRAHGEKMGFDECRKAGVDPDSEAGQKIRKEAFARAAAPSFVHEESSLIGKMMTTYAIRSGRDVVLDATMNNGVEQRMKELAYWRSLPNVNSVRMIVFSCDTDEALRRAKSRELDSRSGSYGRVVPPRVLAEAHTKVSANVPVYAKSGLFDSIMVMDTNGRPAKPMAVLENGKMRPLDKKLYDAFLAKANKDLSGYDR